MGEEGKVDSIDLANVLMLLSRGAEDHTMDRTTPTTRADRVFECKTCSRQFPSFQALGGHRTSHKRAKVADDHDRAGARWKTKVHQCSICGLEFAIGQALGGHMRRHRTPMEGFGHGFVEKKTNGKRVLLDLNLPPLEEDIMEGRNLGLGLGLGVGFCR